MKQTLLFAVIALIIAGAGYTYNVVNPPPVKHYKIVYFGAKNCGACQHWRKNELPDWKSTEAAQHTQLVIKEALYLTQLRPESFAPYNEAWRKAGAGAKGVPAFALVDVDTNRITATYRGIGGWKRLERRVKQSHRSSG